MPLYAETLEISNAWVRVVNNIIKVYRAHRLRVQEYQQPYRACHAKVLEFTSYAVERAKATHRNG